ncbi:MAG: GNAT family N-acetyltransferase [Oscillatoriales cyanobacterium SM2_1_8]|nr:GNAT family N-acetyltransferase [Oscillatoriales cyanobacterium SM2_1_8]
MRCPTGRSLGPGWWAGRSPSLPVQFGDRPPCRRLGYATQLLQRCEALAQEGGAHALHLHVLENNEPARRLYARQGFRAVASPQGWWPPRRLLLRKILV